MRSVALLAVLLFAVPSQAECCRRTPVRTAVAWVLKHKPVRSAVKAVLPRACKCGPNCQCGPICRCR